MTGYRLRFTHQDRNIDEALTGLDDLAERIALEQLAHEVNPAEPAGYAVTFRVLGAGRGIVAAGHFYVRAATAVPAVVESVNSPS